MQQPPATNSATVPDYLSLEFDPLTHLAHKQRLRWEKQEKVLEGYATAGTIKAGVLKSGVPRRTVEYWRSNDYLGFARRLEWAHKMFCDEIEDAMWVHASKLKPGQNPTMLIALANANMPEKYRGTAPQINIDARSISAELAQIGRAMLPGQAPTQAPTTEGGAGLSAGAEEV